MLVQASWTEEGCVVFRLYRTGAEAANSMRGTRHLYTLKNVKSAFLARIFIPFRRREFTKSFTVSLRKQDAHAQTRPGYEAMMELKKINGWLFYTQQNDTISLLHRLL